MQHSEFVSDEAHTLRNALANSPIAFSYFDRTDRLRYWNTAYEDLNFRVRSMIVEGAYFPDLLAELVVRDQIDFSDIDKQSWIDQRLAERNYGATGFRKLTDGRIMLVQERKDAIGGTLGFWLDASDLFYNGVIDKNLRPVCPQQTALSDAGRQNLIREKLQVVLGSLEILRFSPQHDDDARLIESAIEASRVVVDMMDHARPAA